MTQPINTTTPQSADRLEDTPHIYVACLAAYNNGKLHGAWIDATQAPETIREAIQAMLKASPEPDAEEWAVHGATRSRILRVGP